MYDYPENCTEFFELLVRLFKLRTLAFPVVNAEVLVPFLCELIGKHPVVEIAVTDQDFILRGLYRVTAAVLAGHPGLKASAGLPVGGNLLHEVRTVL